MLYGGSRNERIGQAYWSLTPKSAGVLSNRAVHIELTEGSKQDPNLLTSRVPCE